MQGENIYLTTEKTLINIMEDGQCLQKGVFDPKFILKDAQRKYKQINVELNSIPGT